jgi:hypothetical protein
LGSNIYIFLIWALFIVIWLKKVLKKQKTNEVKKCYNYKINLKRKKERKKPKTKNWLYVYLEGKKKKKPNFKKMVITGGYMFY